VVQNNAISNHRTGASIQGTNVTFTGNTFRDNATEHGSVTVNGALAFAGNTADPASPPRLLRLNGTVLERTVRLRS